MKRTKNGFEEQPRNAFQAAAEKESVTTNAWREPGEERDVDTDEVTPMTLTMTVELGYEMHQRLTGLALIARSLADELNADRHVMRGSASRLAEQIDRINMQVSSILSG